MTTAAPRRPPAAISRHRSTRLTGSTPVLGSSRTSSDGRCMIAMQNPSLRRIPPDSCDAQPVRRCGQSRRGEQLVAPRGESSVRRMPVDPGDEVEVLPHGQPGPAARRRGQVPGPACPGRSTVPASSATSRPGRAAASSCPRRRRRRPPRPCRASTSTVTSSSAVTSPKRTVAERTPKVTSRLRSAEPAAPTPAGGSGRWPTADRPRRASAAAPGPGRGGTAGSHR